MMQTHRRSNRHRLGRLVFFPRLSKNLKGRARKQASLLPDCEGAETPSEEALHPTEKSQLVLLPYVANGTRNRTEASR